MKSARMLTIFIMAVGLTVCLAPVGQAGPMSTAFTYQGRLIDDNEAADGLYDFQFKLYDDPNVADGNQVGTDVDVPDVDVVDGYFTVELDFGSNVFDGNAVWLETGIRAGELDDPNVYTVLSPRREVTATPYALQTRGLFVDESLNVGIGTTAPISRLEVMATESRHGIRSTVPYIAVLGHRTGTSGTWPAVHGECDSESSGTSGVRGVITSTTPGSLSAGVYGNNSGTGSNGVGVRGLHAGSGAGVYGQCDAGKGVYGVTTTGYAGYFTGGKNYFQGRVGIGTASPSAGLHVKGTGWPDAFMFLQSDADNDAGIRLYEGDTVKWHVFNESSGDGLSIRNNAYSSVLYAKQSNGNVGIGTTAPSRKLTVRGNLLIESAGGAAVVELGEGLDYAEGFDVTEKQGYGPGTVLVIDSDNPGNLTVSRSAYDSRVAGIVAGGKGLGSGVRLGGGQFDYDVALAGRVYCSVDATEAGVEAGDLLTTSTTAGYAMKATDYGRAHGAILGKAMERLEQGQKGQILVLVSLQ